MNQQQLEHFKKTDRVRRNTTTALRKILQQATDAGLNAGLNECETLGSIQTAMFDVICQSEILHCRKLHPSTHPYEMVALLATALGNILQESWNDLNETSLDG